MDLVLKLLSARKRARDWKQEEYSYTLLHVLRGACCLLGQRIEPRSEVSLARSDLQPYVVHLSTALGQVSPADLLAQVATALGEVCLLMQAGLKQPQQQQQQAGQGAAQQRPLLWQVAPVLLSFWVTVDIMRSEVHDTAVAEPAKALVKQKPALELAVVILQTLRHVDNFGGDLLTIAQLFRRYGVCHCSSAHWPHA